MKHFRMLAAGLCSAVLLCGFAIPAYAYSDSGNEEPPVVEETPPPEPAPTITPGEGFSDCFPNEEYATAYHHLPRYRGVGRQPNIARPGKRDKGFTFFCIS